MGACGGLRQERDGRKKRGGGQPQLRLCLSLPAASIPACSPPARRACPPPPHCPHPPPPTSLFLLPRPHHPRFPESDGPLLRHAYSVKQLIVPSPPGCAHILTPPVSIAITLAAAATTSCVYATTPITFTTATDVAAVATLILAILLPCGGTNAGEQVGEEAGGAGGRRGGGGRGMGGCRGGC